MTIEKDYSVNETVEKLIKEKSSLKVSELIEEIAGLKDQIEFLKSTVEHYQNREKEIEKERKKIGIANS